MDFQLKGKNAIICASSKGLGKACAAALAQEGVNVWISARTAETLELARQEIAAISDGDVHAVVADVTTPEGRDALLAACPTPDIPGQQRRVGRRPATFASGASKNGLMRLMPICLAPST